MTEELLSYEQQRRIGRLASPSNFTISIEFSDFMVKELSESEWERLQTKLVMLERMVRNMAASFVKGTIKYTEDESERSLESWLGHFVSDFSDSFAYLHFMEDALAMRLKEQEKSSGV